ncbi:MAG: HAMP domain-containing histidine kinase [Nitrospinae bacterium]|nr:HAMP domain-containing histidine kinase [Nitrospinota bacterium]
MQKARENIGHILSSGKESIIGEWIAHVRKHQVYADRSHDELLGTVSSAFNGYLRFIRDGDRAHLDDFIGFIAAKRLAHGFPLSAVQYGLEVFRGVAAQRIFSLAPHSDQPKMLNLVFEAVNYAKNHFAELYQDLTASKIQEQMRELESAIDQLKEEKARSEASARLKEQFLSNISHELRTPLTVVLGFSRLIANGTAPAEKAPELAGLIQKAGSSLLRMVEEILLMSKLATGNAKLYSHYVWLNDLISEAVKKAQMEFPEHNRKWDVVLPEPEPKIVGDHQKLEVLFFHLVANAMKFSPPGSRIIVRARVDNPAGFVIVDVIDEGIGIPDHVKEWIFDRFRQIEENLARKYSGMGHGLALAKMIANVHGGDVTLSSSEQGKGSAFTVTLPINGSSGAQTVNGQKNGVKNGVKNGLPYKIGNGQEGHA